MTSAPEKSIVWLDIDNTLYPGPGSGIATLMKERIRAYFLEEGLSGNYNEADKLAGHYFSEYGLSLRGLIRHHNIDPLDFDRRVDGSLPLETILRPDPQVRKLLEDLDRSKTRVWALTNAYKNHANRVLKILRLDDLIEETIYCDYGKPGFTCKPEAAFYQNALTIAGVTDPSTCFFVDDSLSNVQAAKKLGWGSCVYFREPLGTEKPDELLRPVEGVDATITSLLQLRDIWPQLFKTSDSPPTIA